MSQLKTFEPELALQRPSPSVADDHATHPLRVQLRQGKPDRPASILHDQDEVSELRPLDDIGENLSVRTGQEVVPSLFHARLKIQS